MYLHFNRPTRKTIHPGPRVIQAVTVGGAKKNKLIFWDVTPAGKAKLLTLRTKPGESMVLDLSWDGVRVLGALRMTLSRPSATVYLRD
jgi:hypothetical protein